jgi:hypothetical protein
VDSVEQRDGSCAESMFRELIDVRTPVEILSAINDLIQDQEEVSRDQPVQADARESTRLQQLIIRPGGEGGFLTRTEVSLAKFCAGEKLKNKSADCLISMIKRFD